MALQSRHVNAIYDETLWLKPSCIPVYSWCLSFLPITTQVTRCRHCVSSWCSDDSKIIECAQHSKLVLSFHYPCLFAERNVPISTCLSCGFMTSASEKKAVNFRIQWRCSLMKLKFKIKIFSLYKSASAEVLIVAR